MAEQETVAFHPDINSLLSLIGDISYGNKEIFLCELLANSAEALYKIRVESFIVETRLDSQPKLFIHIVPDKTTNTLTIIDSGIGMTKADLKCKLGGISSHRIVEHMRYTKKYIETGIVTYADVPLREQFGPGFYSAFLVADKVVVTTKHNDDEQYVWESQAGCGSFTITRDSSGDRLGRGTKITLFLKEDQREYLEELRLKDVVDKCYNIVRYPISILVDGNNTNTANQIFDDDEDEQKRKEQLAHQFEGLRNKFKDVLGDKVNEVVVSDRVIEFACNLSVEKTLEINPVYPLIEELRKNFDAGGHDNYVTGVIELLFQAAYSCLCVYAWDNEIPVESLFRV